MVSETDAQLAAATRRGDVGAFGVLVARYLPAIYDFVARLVDDEEATAAVTRQVFVAAFERLRPSRREDPPRFRLLAFSLAYELATEHLRNSPAGTDVRSPVGVPDEGPSQQGGVFRRVVGLDVTARAVLDLHARQGFSMREIAEVVGADPRRADMLLARVLIELDDGTEDLDHRLFAYASFGAIASPADLAEAVRRDLAAAPASGAPDRSGAPPETTGSTPRRWRAWIAAALFTAGFVGVAIALLTGLGLEGDDDLSASVPPSPALETSPLPSPSEAFTPPDLGPGFNAPFVVDPSPVPTDEPTKLPSPTARATQSSSGANVGPTPSQATETPNTLTVEILEPEDGTIVIAEEISPGDWFGEIRAAARASDPEGQRLEGAWYSDQHDHVLGRTGRPLLRLGLPDGCPGDPLVHVVTVEVTDPDGNTATDSIRVEVRCPAE